MIPIDKKRIVFTYDRNLDRYSAGFLVIEPTDLRYIADKALTNDEQDMLAEVVDFGRLFSGDLELHSITPDELDIVTQMGEFHETRFAELYDKLVNL
jgi:hypothetical protein